MNFFDRNCQQGPFSNQQFGICDDENGGIAYVAFQEPPQWVATVDNPKQVSVTFTAIDKCVIKDGEEEGRGRCDGMLTTAKRLYLVELKAQKSSWQSGATEQLKSTIRFLQESADLSNFRYKKAFACNRKHPRFVVIGNEAQRAFYKEFGFRLDIQANILIED